MICFIHFTKNHNGVIPHFPLLFLRWVIRVKNIVVIALSLRKLSEQVHGHEH